MQRHGNRLERLAAARQENTAKLARASPQASTVTGLVDEDDDVDWEANLEGLQRMEQYDKAMDEALWTGPPPWKDPSVWYNTSGMQVLINSMA